VHLKRLECVGGRAGKNRIYVGTANLETKNGLKRTFSAWAVLFLASLNEFSRTFSRPNRIGGPSLIDSMMTKESATNKAAS